MTHAPNDFALVIGIDHYPGLPVGKSLRGADADATKFAEWLRSRGGLSPENVHLLCSREKPLAPLQDAIDAELGAIRDCRSSSDRKPRRFYFYFSGHGHVRIGQDDDTPALCLPHFSAKSQAAALQTIRAVFGSTDHQKSSHHWQGFPVKVGPAN